MKKLIGTVAVGYCGWRHLDLGVLTQVSEDEIIHAWLKAEIIDPRHQFAKAYKRSLEKNGSIELGGPNRIPYVNSVRLGLEKPNLLNEEQNRRRREVFYDVRGKYGLWEPIHLSTTWYKTRMILNYQKPEIYGPFPPKTPSGFGTNLNNIIL